MGITSLLVPNSTISLFTKLNNSVPTRLTSAIISCPGAIVYKTLPSSSHFKYVTMT